MKIQHNIISAITALVAAFIISACSSDDQPKEPQPNEPTVKNASRAILVYMVADNNLSSFSQTDLDEMSEVASQACNAYNGRWIVYYSGSDRRPRLIEFDSDGRQTILSEYDTNQSSVSIDRMRKVVSDFKLLAPADNYGIVLWSHGTGWIDDSGSVNEQSSSSIRDNQLIDPLSFGYDGISGKKMKVSSLAKALEGNMFDFIYFDCCHMATIEVAYELRNVAKKMVACPTELGVEGMPYDQNISPLIRDKVEDAASNTFQYYANHFNIEADADRYTIYGCCISVIDLSKLDRLAAATKAIYESGAKLPDDYQPVKYFRQGVTDGIYDMAHYMSTLTSDQTLLSGWNQAFNDVMIQTNTTSKVYNLPAEHFTGLGAFIPQSASQLNVGGFNTYQWYSDVVSSAKLN